MKVRWTVEGNATGIHPYIDVIEIPDEDLEGFSDKDRDDLIESWVQDAVSNVVQWGWTIVNEED